MRPAATIPGLYRAAVVRYNGLISIYACKLAISLFAHLF